MKLRLLTFVGVLCWWGASGCAQAQSGTNRPFLWKIDAGGAKPAHLFGSIHVPSPLTTNLPAVVDRALAAADVVLCEMPLDQAAVMQAAVLAMTAKRPLSEALPADLRDRADAELRRIMPALTLQALDRAEIWVLSFQLMLLGDQMKYPDVLPLDLLVYRRGETAGREVGGLETVREQIDAMNSFTHDEQLELLRATLDDCAKARAEGRTPTQDLLAFYLTGDAEALTKEADRTLSAYAPDLRKRFEEGLVASRNKRMAERIVAKLKAAPEKQHFIAIGALHVVGDGSVVDLLRQAGLKVERVAP